MPEFMPPDPVHSEPPDEPGPPDRLSQFLAGLTSARQVTVKAGAAVYEAEQAATALYFILRGQVRVQQVAPDGPTRLVEILGPGDWFGIPALARLPRYDMRAVAVTETALYEIAAAHFFAALAGAPDIAAELITQLAAKVQFAYENAATLVFDNTNQRLIRTLLHFSQTAAATPQEGGVVLRITHQQLAQAVGAARETVSLALTRLRRRNLLRTGRNRLFFNPEALRQFTERPMPAGPAEQQESAQHNSPPGTHT